MQFLRAVQRLARPVARISTRQYAISVKPPVTYEGKIVPRKYGETKSFLYHQYTRMLDTTTDCPIIFLQHKNFSVARLQKLRRDIQNAHNRYAASHPDDISLTVPPSLTIIRTSIFGAALRDFSPLDRETIDQIANIVENGLAVLMLPSLNPPQLDAVIRALERSAPLPTEPEAQTKKTNPTDDPNFVPGRKPQRVRPVLTPELKVMGGLIERRVFAAEGVKDVTNLPTLNTLRAQIVGLLSAPALQLAMVLGEASGGKLARTLEGLKKSLEEGQEDNSPPS